MSNLDGVLLKAKTMDIVSYLNKIGLEESHRNMSKVFFSSPFSRDTNASFCVYLNTNTFYDWSTGHHGDVVDLCSLVNKVDSSRAIDILLEEEIETYRPNYKVYEQEEFEIKDFQYKRYLTRIKSERNEIRKYAKSRMIRTGYLMSFFCTRSGDSFIRHPSMGFLHTDYDGNPCGIKLRKVRKNNMRDGRNKPRFSARGTMKYYVLDNIFDSIKDPKVYIIESESSANSLYERMLVNKVNGVVISYGGVSSLPSKILPKKYEDIFEKRVLIDFDGDEELYKERVSKFVEAGMKPVDLKLEKGEDVNSLFVKGDFKTIDKIFDE